MSVHRLGVQQLVPSMEVVPIENSLRILSCSAVIPRKQVVKIAEALMFMPDYVSVTWTHIGGGPLLGELEKQCFSIAKTKPNITCVLLGNLTNTQVKTFYKTNSVDLFINVSESEGVPVSIMECMSVGVPALATDVDGNSEIVVDGYNGYLLQKQPTPQAIANSLMNVIELKEERKQLLKKNALNTWSTKYNATSNYDKFARILNALING
jgi:colanic acid/amylovoran biosynthesis glycosyltransferase